MALAWVTCECHQQLREEDEVATVAADQCMYGIKTRGPGGRDMPAQKPTRFMTNSRAIAKELGKRCDGSRQHQPFVERESRTHSHLPKGVV